MKNKTIRQLIEEGSFNINEYNVFQKENYIDSRKKHSDNLKSWQSWYGDKCNSGVKQMKPDWRNNNQMKEFDEIVTRKNPMYSWHFLGNGGICFSQDSRIEIEKVLNSKDIRIDTSNDKFDKQQLWFVNKELEEIFSKQQSFRKRN